MATIQEGIYNAMKDNAAISAKVKAGTNYNIYPIYIPDNRLKTNSYHIVYQKLHNTPLTFIDVQRPHFQISAVADTYSKSQELAGDIISVFERFKGNLGSQRIIESCVMIGEAEFQSPDTKMWYVALTFKFKLFGDNV